jgi:hypothetical protein
MDGTHKIVTEQAKSHQHLQKLVLDPAERVAVAGELIEAAWRRFGAG